MATRPNSPQGTESSIVLAQFLEATIHSILYHRNVYPASSFERTQLYGMVVHVNRHPIVVEYVKEVAAKAASGGYIIDELRIIIYAEKRMPTFDGDESGAAGKERTGEEAEVYRLVFSPSMCRGVAQPAHSEKGMCNSTDKSRIKWQKMYHDFKALLLRVEAVSRHTAYQIPTNLESLARRTFRVQLLARKRLKNEPENAWMVVGRSLIQPEPKCTIPLHEVQLADECMVENNMLSCFFCKGEIQL